MKYLSYPYITCYWIIDISKYNLMKVILSFRFFNFYWTLNQSPKVKLILNKNKFEDLCRVHYRRKTLEILAERLKSTMKRWKDPWNAFKYLSLILLFHYISLFQWPSLLAGILLAKLKLFFTMNTFLASWKIKGNQDILWNTSETFTIFGEHLTNS